MAHTAHLLFIVGDLAPVLNEGGQYVPHLPGSVFQDKFLSDFMGFNKCGIISLLFHRRIQS